LASPAAAQQDVLRSALIDRERELKAKGLPAALRDDGLRRLESDLSLAEQSLRAGRVGEPTKDEVTAAAEALHRGVSGADVSQLASSAPSGRSLAVPLLVISSLMDRGLPADEALARVASRLTARVTDRDLEIETPRPAQSNRANPGAPEVPRPTNSRRPATLPENPGRHTGATNHGPPPRSNGPSVN
jgi:hypothetical protein